MRSARWPSCRCRRHEPGPERRAGYPDLSRAPRLARAGPGRGLHRRRTADRAGQLRGGRCLVGLPHLAVRRPRAARVGWPDRVEVDDVDRAHALGLERGRHRTRRADRGRRRADLLRAFRDPQPWAPGLRLLYLRLAWDTLTGRRVSASVRADAAAAARRARTTSGSLLVSAGGVEDQVVEAGLDVGPDGLDHALGGGLDDPAGGDLLDGQLVGGVRHLERVVEAVLVLGGERQGRPEAGVLHRLLAGRRVGELDLDHPGDRVDGSLAAESPSTTAGSSLSV